MLGSLMTEAEATHSALMAVVIDTNTYKVFVTSFSDLEEKYLDVIIEVEINL